ncbi:MAG: helix-turn-helix transcriptional regulator [Psychrobacillus sp.]
MQTLGERIRTLRKQQKMTLEALAGTELTKGMLSLIENNKAKPSMESLQYIAKRLDVDVSELLEEVSGKELREVLEKAEILFNTNYNDLSDEYEQLIQLVEPYLPNIGNGYESARLLEMYSRCMYQVHKKDWEEPLKQAAELYEKLNITSRRAKIGIVRAMVKFQEHNYEDALHILQQERAELDKTGIWIDPVSRLDFDYTETALYYAIGNYESALKLMDQAIEYSKENKTFYHLDDLYRIASAHAMMQKDEEKIDYYIKKIEAYGIFADDPNAEYFSLITKIHYLNSYKYEYEEAEEIFQTYTLAKDKIFTPYFMLEQGKTFYGLKQFESAVKQLEQVVIPETLSHPIDLSIFYEKDAYLALCYKAKGQIEKAKEAVQKAYDNISHMPATPYKTFIVQTYKQINLD